MAVPAFTDAAPKPTRSTDSVSPSSSRSLTSTPFTEPTLSTTSSLVVPTSATATGASLTPPTVIDTVAVEVPPLPSLMV